MDRGRCLVFEGYGVGPNFCRLLVHFWDEAEMVCQAGGYYDITSFQAGRGVTQGGAVPSDFHLGRKCSEFLVVFYANDSIIANREPERLQQSLDALVSLFGRVGLITNTEKTKAMTIIPGKI